jgi:DNA-binding SARP family transcriptional activator
VLEFRLLGSLEALDDGRRLPLGGRQQRALLAMLLLRPNEVVPAERLIDAIWGERPPPTASTMVQLYVSRLRKLLGRDLLLTRPGSYELQIDPLQIDRGHFEALLAAAADTDDDAERARSLRDALALWRGAALVDFAYDGFAAGESGRLDELRLLALEDRIDADLALGCDAQLVGELEALVVEQPLRERLRGQLMLALYRSGRQTDALDTYREGRRVLVDELGLEPGPSLRRLQQQILDHDPALQAAERLEQQPVRREERKVVTALFADLAGLGEAAFDPEDARALLDPILARMRAELQRFGGTVEALVGGTVAAIFGVPIAHEDDAERAVRAGLACRDIVAEVGGLDPKLHCEVRIGVDTGEVFVHGDEIVGASVTTADRLRLSAPANAVVVTEATRRATTETIDYESGEPLSTPGLREPIPVWLPVAPRAPIRIDRPQARTAALVGRAGELDLIRTRLQRARTKVRTDLVTLVGPPGIGKTRLLREASHLATDFLWLQGRSIPYGDGVAYWALAAIVKMVAGILDTDAPATAGQKLHREVQRTIADDPDSVEGQLRVLLALDSRDRSSERSAAFTGWTRYLTALAAKRPVVLALEDVHWADDGLLDFVAHLQATTSAAPILVLCTARPDLLDRRPDWKPVVELTPLSSDETRSLLIALLGLEFLPRELEPVIALVGGNPLFAEEYARVVADGRTADLVLPDSVHQVIAARLDALPVETKALLQDAAVVGKVFWRGALSSVSGLDPSSCTLRLKELVRRDLIMREPGSAVAGESQYAFKHILIRDVAYSGIPRAQRASKHRQTAEWIEARARDDDVAELLAHHYGNALEFATAARLDTNGLGERAAEAFWRAGERARQLYANAEATEYFRRALATLDGTTGEDAEWLNELTAAVLESLGDVLELTGAHEDGEAAFARAEALLTLGDRVRRARLLRKQGQSRQLQRRIDDSTAAYAAAEAALAKRPSGNDWWQERCEIGLQRVQLLYFTAPSERLQDGVATYRPIIEGHGTAEQRSRLFAWMGLASLRGERFVAGEQTLEYLRAGLAAGQESGDVSATIWMTFCLGFALLWAWRLDEAEVHLTAALEMSERVGDATHRTRCLAYLTIVHRRRGDVGAAGRLVKVALEAARDAHMEEYVVQGNANLAWIAWREGNYPRAEALARDAWDGWDGYLQQRLLSWSPVFPLFGLAVRAGRRDEARELVEVLLDTTRQGLPHEVEETLREGRLEDACAVAERYGYL